MEQLSDHHLIAAVVRQITPPKRRQSTSFQLHAPLELLARVALLPHVRPEARAGARQKLIELGAKYEANGEAAGRVEVALRDVPHAAAALVDALTHGDPDTADAALIYLLDHEPLPTTLARLRPILVDHLGAAAHAPILVAELPRVADRIPGVAQLLRAPLRSLLQHPAHLGWHRTHAGAAHPDAEARLLDALRAPTPTASATTSIAPTMRSVEDNGLAPALLGDAWRGLSTPRAEVVLSRLAAWSMLQEPATHAPYGWTHALTLPQAMLRMTLGTDDAPAGVAVAATYLLGFRATLGTVRLEPTPPVAIAEAGAAWTAVATDAALHTDAHFAKYVVACLDAAARDRGFASLYLAAAQRLGAFWASR